MANIKSAKKRIRQNEKRRLHNRYYAKTARNFMRSMRAEEDVAKVAEMMPELQRKLDKLVKMNIIHRNKAANLKSAMARHITSMQVS